MNYNKLVEKYIKHLKHKTGYVMAKTSEEKQKFLNEGLNALYIVLQEVPSIVDSEGLEETLTNFGYTKLEGISIYKRRSAQQFLSLNTGMLN
ncbi:MAG: hypothetical protein E7311_05535 [Clostridiales bacterium]|nr:hypothetical protein [Clostridiales bacterium]